jgi:TonB family protein
MVPALRIASLAKPLSVLGLSAALHAAVLFTAVGHPAPPQGASNVVGVEGLTVLEPPLDLPEAAQNVSSATGRATKWPMHVHSDRLPRSRETARLGLRQPPAADAARPVTIAPDDAPRFATAMGKRAGEAPAAVLPGGVVPREPGQDAPVAEEAVDTQARPLNELAPAYPVAARAEGVEGEVQLELVVGVSGAVEKARVVGAAGHGLDEAALAAAQKFRFFPATIAGKPVRVRMGYSIEFRLQ